MKINLIILILIRTGSGLFAQQWLPVSKSEAISIVAKMDGWYKSHPDYTVKVNHNSYLGYQGTVPHEQDNGFLVVRGSSYHSNMLGVETIQNADYKIVIDTSDREILISNPDHWFNYFQNIPDSFSLRGVSACYLMKKKNFISLRLDYKPGYKMERHVITLDDEYKIQEIAFYFRPDFDEENADESHRPKVVIEYSDYQIKNSTDFKNEFKTENYFSSGDTNKLIPAPGYDDFELIDTRVK